MLPISSQSLNGANSASRRAREVPKKKENHQNLTPEIMSKSNPVHPGVLHGTPKFFDQFYCIFNALVRPNLQRWTGFDLLII